jgi:hypothetical protein
MTSYGKDGRTETPASNLLAGRLDDRGSAQPPPLRLSLVATDSNELRVRAEMAWRGMCTMHALDLLRCHRFVRTGRLTPGQVHQIAQDHLALRRPADDFDATVQAVLDRADELQHARTGQNVGVIV